MISEVHYMLGRFLKNCDVDQMVNNLVCWPPLVKLLLLPREKLSKQIR